MIGSTVIDNIGDGMVTASPYTEPGCSDVTVSNSTTKGNREPAIAWRHTSP